MRPSFTVTYLLLLCLIICQVKSDHILFMHTCSTYSHRVGQWPIVEGLLAKGHNVTFISPWGASGLLSNAKVTEIVPQQLHLLAKKLLEENFDINYRAYGILPPLFLVLELFCYQVCDKALTSPEVQSWLAKKPKVDLVVGDFMNDCSYGMSLKLGAKNALFSPVALATKHFESFGIDPETSSVPDFDVSRPPTLTFLNRLTGALLPLWWKTVDIISYPFYRSLFQRALGLEKIPGVDKIKELTDLIIINGDYLSDYPRSWPPFVVKVEGIHIKKEKKRQPLPKEVEQFIQSKNEDGSDNDGFLFMSFGTVAKAPSLPEELKNTFFETVEAFPNIRFIWKWDGKKAEKYPKNLLLVSWIDQQDLLAHPKIRGFLTQAGRPSTQEALYHKVPMITFPILADQDFVAHRSNNLGVSVLEEIVGLTKEKLQNAINKIVYEKKYKERVTQLANLAKDVPQDPIDVAVWWVEFVLRHTKEELDLLKPLARHLNWFQRRDLDVWLFFLVLFLAGMYLTVYVVNKLLNRYIFSKKARNNSKTEKGANGKKQN